MQEKSTQEIAPFARRDKIQRSLHIMPCVSCCQEECQMKRTTGLFYRQHLIEVILD